MEAYDQKAKGCRRGRTRKNVFNKGIFFHRSPDRSNRTVNPKGSCHKGASLWTGGTEPNRPPVPLPIVGAEVLGCSLTLSSATTHTRKTPEAAPRPAVSPVFLDFSPKRKALLRFLLLDYQDFIMVSR